MAEFVTGGPGKARAMAQEGEFEEIRHSGGKVIFHVVADPDGRRSYQLTYRGNRPVPTAMFAVYALPQGVAVAPIKLGGIGQPWNPPPFHGCIPVFIGSDGEVWSPMLAMPWILEVQRLSFGLPILRCARRAARFSKRRTEAVRPAILRGAV